MMILEANDIVKTYTDMAEPVEVLRGVSLKIDKGQLIGIYGASGSGKSTLLHILGGLDAPTAGSVKACDYELGRIDSTKLAHFRNTEVGFVFQFYHLLPEFTALENVMIPVLVSGKSRGDAKRAASAALDAMGLSERSAHRPAMLSGGEQQRVALARAAVMHPKIIFADEPTGNLDRETGDKVWNFLLELNRNKGIALVIVTHNRELMRSLSTVYELRDGLLHELNERNTE